MTNSSAAQDALDARKRVEQMNAMRESDFKHVVVRSYADIPAKRTEWFDGRRIPRAMLSLIVGSEGLGKTAIALWMIAQATQGRLPGCFSGEPVNAVLLTPEDDPSRTIRPRLEAAGADLSKVFDLKMRAGESDVGFSLPGDTAEIAQALIQSKARVIFSDPLASMLDPKMNSWKDTDVRRALEPLVSVCAEHDITWLGSLHTNKTNSTDPRQRGMGSAGWRILSRASLLVGLDPDDPDGANGGARCIGHDKHNLGIWTPTRRFTLESGDVEIEGTKSSVVKANMGDECDVGCAQMLAAEQGFEKPEASKEDQAMKWLSQQLDDGPKAVKDLESKAGDAGHMWRTVVRAKKELGASSAQQKGAKGHVWKLPALHV
jgi:hypothetical protein